MIIITPSATGLLLTDSATGQTLALPAGDLAAFVRRLAAERYATGYTNGRTEGRALAEREQAQRERRGPAERAKIALN